MDASVDKDGDVVSSDYGEGDDYNPAEVSLQSNAPVHTGHEYGVESDGYVCYYDGEEGDECDYVTTAYASVDVAAAGPTINSITPSSVNQGDTGTLTISGSNLVQSSGDQLSLNYSGSGMPFTLSGTPSSTSASFSYNVSGYDPGTYTISVTNNEGTSNTKNFTVNPPTNACT